MMPKIKWLLQEREKIVVCVANNGLNQSTKKSSDGNIGCKCCMWAGMVRSNDDELSCGCKPDARGNALSEHEKTDSHKTNLPNFVDVVCKEDLTSLGGVTLPGDKILDKDRDGRIVIGAQPASAIAEAASRKPGVLHVPLRRRVSRQLFPLLFPFRTGELGPQFTLRSTVSRSMLARFDSAPVANRFSRMRANVQFDESIKNRSPQ